MKKITLLFLSLIAAVSMIACTSTSTMDDGAKKQAEFNKSLDKVYGTYANDLVLDGAEYYEVKSGDTLTAITKKFYVGKDENGYYFPLIMLASRDVVKDPELIEPGMKLTIPNFDANINDKEVAKKLSPYFKELAEVYKQKDTQAAADILPHLIEISETLGKETAAPEAEPEPAPAAEEPAAVEAAATETAAPETTN